MKERTLRYPELRSLLAGYIDNNGFAVATKSGMLLIWNHLITYAKEQSEDEYSRELGDKFLNSPMVLALEHSYQNQYRRLIYVLNCLLMEENISKKTPSARTVPHPTLSHLTEDYVSYCSEAGNAPTTLRNKAYHMDCFLRHLAQCGCNSLNDLTPEIVLRISLMEVKTNTWKELRMIFHYLYDNGFVSIDYSGLLPHRKEGYKLPDTYSHDELLILDQSFDISTAKGKKDYAIFSLASRLLLRSVDISELKISSVNLDNNTISLCQSKTDEKLILPLPEDAKAALQDYINNARPHSNEPYVFLQEKAPHKKMTSSAIYIIISSAFKRSGIDTSGKRKGGHVLRASGATHMVNSGITYQQVQKALGQSGENTITHYARLDVKKLRVCALQPPLVTTGSYFDRFIKGEVLCVAK